MNPFIQCFHLYIFTNYMQHLYTKCISEQDWGDATISVNVSQCEQRSLLKVYCIISWLSKRSLNEIDSLTCWAFLSLCSFECNQIHYEKTLKYTKMWKPFTGQRPSCIAAHLCEIQVLNVLFSHFWGGYGQLFPAGPQVSARRHGSALSRARGQQMQHARIRSRGFLVLFTLWLPTVEIHKCIHKIRHRICMLMHCCTRLSPFFYPLLPWCRTK